MKKATLAAIAVALLALGGHAMAPEVRSAASDTPTRTPPPPTAPPVTDALATASGAGVASRRPRHGARSTAATAELRDCGGEQRDAMRAWLARQPTAITPRAGITQALMLGYSDRGKSQQLAFAQLLRRWPMDVDVAWMAWHRCFPGPLCDPVARARHLAEVDRDNGGAWLALMDSASPVADMATLDYALARAAQAPVFDLRLGNWSGYVFPILASLPPSPHCWKQIQPELAKLTGPAPTPLNLAYLQSRLGENLLQPPGFALGFACVDRDGRRLAPSRRRDCVTVLERLTREQTLSTRSRALRLLIPLLGGGEASATWRERYRRLRWLGYQARAIKESPDSGARVLAEGEFNYYLGLLRDQGLWPPPPAWLPDDADSRSLILEGR
jgi:hypothetical protein